LIWTDAPLWLRFWRITWRSLRSRGQTRPDLADGCPERLSGLPEFWRFLWVNRHRIHAKLKTTYDAATIPKRKLSGFDEINAFVMEVA